MNQCNAIFYLCVREDPRGRATGGSKAIQPGTPIANYVKLKMSGGFRPQPDRDWLSMQASQIISTFPGFVWRATIGKGLSKLIGADYYHKSNSRMRFSLGGLIPVVDV